MAEHSPHFIDNQPRLLHDDNKAGKQCFRTDTTISANANIVKQPSVTVWGHLQPHTLDYGIDETKLLKLSKLGIQNTGSLESLFTTNSTFSAVFEMYASRQSAHMLIYLLNTTDYFFLRCTELGQGPQTSQADASTLCSDDTMAGKLYCLLRYEETIRYIVPFRSVGVSAHRGDTTSAAVRSYSDNGLWLLMVIAGCHFLVWLYSISGFN